MNPNSKISLKALLAELKRPRYGALEVLVLPRSIKVGKTGLKQLAKCLPDLKALDFGFSASNLHPSDAELCQAATEFTSLVSLRTDMWHVTSYGIRSLSATMGARLLDFRVADDPITKNYFTDLAANALAQNCPNLKRLTVMGGRGSNNYEPVRDLFTVTSGLRPLLVGCTSLERLELIGKLICNSGFEPVAVLLESMRASNRAIPPLKVFTMAPNFARMGAARGLRDRIRAIVPSFDNDVVGFTYTEHGRWAQEAADD